MKKILKCLLTGLALAVLTGLPAAALAPASNAYVLEGNKRAPMPVPYELQRTVSVVYGEGDTALNNAQDMFYDKQGRYYIADTGNNRVLELDLDFKVTRMFTGGDGLDFAGPTGVSTDEYGDIYITDADNGRIVHLNADGQFIESFVKPVSDLLYDVTYFSPAKAELSPVNHYLYVIQGKQFMTLDALNGFKGYVGDNKVGFDLWDFLFRKFATEKQKQQIPKRMPDPYTNFCIGEDGRMYAVGSSDSQRISVINTVGSNIYPAGDYGETMYEDDGTGITPQFTDIAVNGYGIISVSEQNTGTVSQYDMEGNLLCVFGGKGTSVGRFGVISSLVVNGNNELVTLDSSLGRIQVFRSTAFMERVHQAIVAYNSGDYDDSYSLWAQVRSTDKSYALARRMMGLIQYKQGDYPAALEEFYRSDDRENYGKVFERLRYTFFQENFVWIAPALCALIIAALIGIKKARKVLSCYRTDLWKQ